MSSLLSKAAAESGMQETTLDTGAGSPASTALPKLPSWSASGWQTLLKQPSAGAFQPVFCARTCRCIQYTSLTCTGSACIVKAICCSLCVVLKRIFRPNPRNPAVLVTACSQLASPSLLHSLTRQRDSPWSSDHHIAVLHAFHVCCMATSSSTQSGIFLLLINPLLFVRCCQFVRHAGRPWSEW